MLPEFILKRIYLKESPVNKNLKRFLEKAGSVFDINALILEAQSTEKVSKYYKKSYLGYKLFNSRDSYIHFALSDNYFVKKDDYVELVKIAENIISEDSSIKNVLELSPGKGANSAYLANKFRNVQFIGLDLTQKKLAKFEKFNNYTQERGDYHNLSRFSNNQFDFVFIIEALCHSTDKIKVLKEIQRVLKPGGLLYIADGYSLKPISELSDYEKIAVKIIERGMALNEIENIYTFEQYVEKVGFQVQDKINVSNKILPNTIKFEFFARAFFKFPRLAKLLVRIFGIHFTKNALSGLFIRTIMERKIGCYYIHILKNPTR